MNWGNAAGIGAFLLSVATAVGLLYKGWRTRVAAAATRPFQVGHEAISEAQTALRMKDERLADAEAERLKAVADLAAATAQVAALQGQVDLLYGRIGLLMVSKSALEEGAKQAAAREEADRRRISALETSLEEMRKSMGLGMSHE
jgi:hypothetical protein